MDRPELGQGASSGVPSTATERPLLTPLIGAQIKTAGGFVKVPQRALDIGAEVVQLFNANARTWRPKPYDPHEIAALRSGLDAHGLPLFFHAIYLINLASPDKNLRQKSSVALAEALFLGAVAHAEGVVVHVGSHRGEGFHTALPWVGESILVAQRTALLRLEEQAGEQSFSLRLPPLLLESSSGSGNVVGRDLGELEALVDVCPEPCGICLDTAHLFAAGIPVHTGEGIELLTADLKTRGLLERLKLIHLNDSRTPYASGRDQHENLGEGQLGYAALKRVVQHPLFQAVPFVLETPGLDGHGPDAFGLRTAKAMRRGDPNPPAQPALSAWSQGSRGSVGPDAQTL